MSNEEEKEYSVTVYEIHKCVHTVHAEDGEEAKEKVKELREEGEELPSLEYVRTKEPEEWSAEV